MLQTPFFPVSFGKSFTKIRSAVPENGCLILVDGKKQKKTKKTSVKHIRYRLIGGCVNKSHSHDIWHRCSASAPSFTVDTRQVKVKADLD